MSDTPRTVEQGHAKLCEGRNYTCTCGYDEAMERELQRALAELAAIRTAEMPEEHERVRVWRGIVEFAAGHGKNGNADETILIHHIDALRAYALRVTSERDEFKRGNMKALTNESARIKDTPI